MMPPRARDVRNASGQLAHANKVLKDALASNFQWKDVHFAAAHNEVSRLEEILQVDPSQLEVADGVGWVPLHHACLRSHGPVARLLLARGANVEARGKDGWTPLVAACCKGDLSMVQTLLYHNADPNTKTDDGLDPLRVCCQSPNRHHLLPYLIRRGANVNLRDKRGFTCLYEASYVGHVLAVRTLLQFGADIETKTVREHWTPLIVATENEHTGVVLELLQNGANPDARNGQGWTPLHIACKRRNSILVEFLLCFNADVEAEAHDGLTPLVMAGCDGIASIVEKLVIAGADTAKDARIGKRRQNVRKLAPHLPNGRALEKAFRNGESVAKALAATRKKRQADELSISPDEATFIYACARRFLLCPYSLRMAIRDLEDEDQDEGGRSAATCVPSMLVVLARSCRNPIEVLCTTAPLPPDHMVRIITMSVTMDIGFYSTKGSWSHHSLKRAEPLQAVTAALQQVLLKESSGLRQVLRGMSKESRRRAEKTVTKHGKKKHAHANDEDDEDACAYYSSAISKMQLQFLKNI